MSHAHGRRDSCSIRLMSRHLHSIRLSLAGGVTDMGVGSGALLGRFGNRIKQLLRCRDNPLIFLSKAHVLVEDKTSLWSALRLRVIDSQSLTCRSSPVAALHAKKDIH